MSKISIAMSGISYLKFDEIKASEFLAVLNSPKVREHLMEHELFTLDSLKSWMAEKIQIDQTPGCKIRAVQLDGKLIGWCGIQCEAGKYELAIILDEKTWGLGKRIYRDLMCWAEALKHKVVYINLLHTRPRYRFLARLARTVTVIQMSGFTFTRYELAVNHQLPNSNEVK